MLCGLVIAFAAASSPSPDDARTACAAGRYDLALEKLDALLGPSPAQAFAAPELLELEQLRARCFFELGDYAACAEKLRALLAGPAGRGNRDHVECLARLAQALSFQDSHAEAIATLERARAFGESPALHRLAVTLLLRAGRLKDVLPHAEALLAADPSEPFAHFVRGLALENGDRLQEALAELAWGLKTPASVRDARFHMASVRAALGQPAGALELLLEIVCADPYDREACYQAAQQLNRLRTAAGAQAAANLQRYFQAIDAALAEADRRHSFEAIGRAVQSALMRADAWKRARAYDRVLVELQRARAIARNDPEPWLYEADFWAGAGILAEAEGALARVEARGGAPAPELAARIGKLRAALAAATEKLRARATTPLGEARLGAALTRWEAARPRLEALLGAAFGAGDLAVADEAARLLLARDEHSLWALAFLAQRAADGALLVPRLHYLTRLARLAPANEGIRARLSAARREFLGEGAAPSR